MGLLQGKKKQHDRNLSETTCVLSAIPLQQETSVVSPPTTRLFFLR